MKRSCLAFLALLLAGAGMLWADQTTSAVQQALKEIHQRFDLTNMVVAPMAVVTYFGPVVVLAISNVESKRAERAACRAAAGTSRAG